MVNHKGGNPFLTKTVNDVYLWLRKLFKSSDIFSPDLEARELVSFVYGVDRGNLPSWAHIYGSDHSERELKLLADRRLSGEPLAYLIGEWDFYSLTFRVTPDVLIPRSDTETLAGFSIDLASQIQNPKVLDLCCGSGCVGITIAKNVTDAKVVGADISEKALLVAKENARRHLVQDRYIPVSHDASAAYDDRLGRFHIVVCNPPYIKTGDIANLHRDVKDFEPFMALDGGLDGLDFYRNIIKTWKKALLYGGFMAFECGSGQAMEIGELMNAQGYTEIKVVSDLSGVQRVVVGRYMENLIR